MGNPHAITFIGQPVAEFPLHTVGPKVEHHPMFPRRVNFEIVNVDAPGKLTARVWERGSGETLACGTGACAIAVAARLSGHCGDQVDITLPGGTLRIQWDGTGEVIMEGPATEVFSESGPSDDHHGHEKADLRPVAGASGNEAECEVVDGVLVMPLVRSVNISGHLVCFSGGWIPL